MNLKEMSSKRLLGDLVCVAYDINKLDLFSKQRNEDTKSIFRIQTELLSRLEQIDDLKCCGNCKVTNRQCPHAREFEYNKQYYCDKWQSDRMTRSQREIK